MDKSREKVIETLKGFGFDDFMAGQIFVALKNKDLINTEPRGDSYNIVSQVLEDQGMDIDEVQTAIEAMVLGGVVFRER